jgi:hypothetical protein
MLREKRKTMLQLLTFKQGAGVEIFIVLSDSLNDSLSETFFE